MFKRVLGRVAALFCLAPLVGCTGALLPSFDGGVLNPDIRYLRVGDVMTGVKCAMAAFLSEREEDLVRDRERKRKQQLYKLVERNFHTYAVNVPEGLSLSKLPEGCPKEQHMEGAVCRLNKSGRFSCTPGTGKCVNNSKDDRRCNPLSQQFWSYKQSKKSRKDGTVALEGACAPVPDYSRFSLDPNQSAKITFSLNAINSGFINYSRIDALRLPNWLQWLVVPGSSNSPFPQMSPTLKGTTTIELAAAMPQSLHAPIPPTVRIRGMKVPAPVPGPNMAPGARSATLGTIGAALSEDADEPAAEPRPRRPYDSDDAELEDLHKYCNVKKNAAELGDTTEIDYLAIKKLLHEVVHQQNKAVHQGAPAVTLDTLTLTTAFQVTLELQAGTRHIFRIVPLLAAPNTDFKGDHTHTLKIVLQGGKRKGDPGYTERLVDSCKQRVQRSAIGGDAELAKQLALCETTPAILLEAMLQNLEAGRSGVSGNE